MSPRVDLASALVLPNGSELPNRIAKAAMSERLCAPGGAPSEELVRLYARWSAGGPGLLITGNVMVDDSIAEEGNVIVDSERHLPALRAWAEAGTRGNTALWMQINHPGRQVPRLVSRRPVAPSAVQMRGTGGLFAEPRALEDHEIEAIVQRFATTAAIAKSAGFTGVQLHGAHGYLISQFLSPLTNRRTDRWGGDPDRRRRFLIEVVRAVRAAVGRHFPVGLKLNSADFQRGGFDQTESMAVVEALDAEGIDLLEVSGGTYESAVMFQEAKPVHASTRTREAYFLEYAEAVRSKTGVPLMVTGGFRSKAGMQAALESGATDVIGLARPLAVEPSLPHDLLTGARDAAAPIRLATGIKKLDALVQGAFYQSQIRRMAEGREPALDLSRWRAVIEYVRPHRATPTPELLPAAAT